MSHPDPLFDAENAYDDDMNYDDHDDEKEEDDVWDDSCDDSMDGDFDSAMRDAGFGTDEDYGYYGDDF